jgi:hypothetical protein
VCPDKAHRKGSVSAKSTKLSKPLASSIPTSTHRLCLQATSEAEGITLLNWELGEAGNCFGHAEETAVLTGSKIRLVTAGTSFIPTNAHPPTEPSFHHPKAYKVRAREIVASRLGRLAIARSVG